MSSSSGVQKAVVIAASAAVICGITALLVRNNGKSKAADEKQKREAEKAKPRVKVAAIQAASDPGDLAGNTKRFTALIREAARNGAKFIVLPEASITGYLSQDLKTNWNAKGRQLRNEFFAKVTFRD